MLGGEWPWPQHVHLDDLLFGGGGQGLGAQHVADRRESNEVGSTGATIGPFAVGVLMDAQAAYIWNFYLFADCAILGAVAALLVPRRNNQPA